MHVAGSTTMTPPPVEALPCPTQTPLDDSNIGELAYVQTDAYGTAVIFEPTYTGVWCGR